MRNPFRRSVVPLLASLLCFVLPTGCGSGGTTAPATPPVPAPAVQSISPSTLSANPAGVTQITITGSGFIASSQVQVGGAGVGTTYVSSITLQAFIPPALLTVPGKLILTVVNGPVSSDPAAPGAALTVTAPAPPPNPVPTVSVLAPAAALTDSPGLTVTLTGTGFIPATTVSVNGGTRSTTYLSPTKVTFTLTTADLAASGSLNIIAINPAPGGGSSAASAFPVNNPMPNLATIAPASVATGAAQFTLDIRGTGFVMGSDVYWGSIALVTTLVSPAELTAVVPAALLTNNAIVTVTVVSPAPGGGQSPGTPFTVLDPVPALTNISPHAVAVDRSTATITLTGAGFAANSVAQWNGAVRPTTVLSATALQTVLSSSDLAAVGTGQLTVTSPSPGGGTTTPLALPITNLPIPVITEADITLPQQPQTACRQLQLHIAGTGFFGGGATTVTLNGQPLQNAFASQTDIFAFLPSGFTSIGNIVVAVSNSLGGAPISSDPFTVSAPASPLLTLCAMPYPATVYPGSNFFLTFAASQVDTTAVPAITGWTLPPGITSTAALPLSVPSPAGVRALFTADSSLAPGSYLIPFTAAAGAATFSGQISLTATAAAPPNFFIQNPYLGELAVSPGGSGTLAFYTTVNAINNPDYVIALSISGLPQGTTATVTPASILPGQNFSVTVNAAADAPLAKNVTVTVTGTPQAAVTPASATFLLDVAPKPGTSPNNRTDFVSTSATPYAAVYDSAHKLVFVSNPSWNRIDVISTQTHAVIRGVPVRGPAGMDLSQDGATVWIGTKSRQVYALDTSTFALRTYMLPVLPSPYQGPITTGPFSWSDNSLLALANGTLFLNIDTDPSGFTFNVIWSPTTNTLTPLQSTFYSALRSGNGQKVFLATVNSSYCSTTVYDVASRTAVNLANLSEVCSLSGVNADGSRIVATDNGKTGLYDGSLNLIGYLPGNLSSVIYSDYGGFVFSPDESTLYELGSASGRGELVATYDARSLALKGVAPALATLILGANTGSNGSVVGVDDTGVLISLANYGIGFNDSAYLQTYAANTPGAGSPISLSPAAGPLAGGTASTPYGFYALTPDIWYGQNRGTASLDSTNTLTITSPPGNAPGPVNLKYLFPDGNQVLSPQAFSYSAYPEYSLLSGATPNGGVPGRIAGYGMPADATGGSLTVGGQPATITTQITQYLPYTGEPFPSTDLDYTIPAGPPGYADLQITTPSGAGTLPKAVFYAKSVADYASSDTFTDVLYDSGRRQVYLSGGDHIDVFSTASMQWLAPLKPAILGAHSQFRGLALSVDGNQLLAANFLDNSLSVVNPDNPSQTFALPLSPVSSSGGTCASGPFSVSALAGNQAFVTTGLPPGIGGCPQNNALYLVNLQTHAVSAPSGAASFIFSCGNAILGGAVGTTRSSADGSHAVIGTYANGICLYSTANQTYTVAHPGALDYIGTAIDADGNLLAVGNALANSQGDLIGGVARPLILYKGISATPYPLNNYPASTLLNPVLNASGSLYFWPYPKWFEIFDVPTGTLHMRFSLAETVQNVETPLAIDEGGRRVFLITDAGLTVVDLGSAPLSIGHLSSGSGVAGAQIQVRGSGFAAGLTATIGGQSATVTIVDESTLTLTVPILTSGPKDLGIANADGTSYTLAGAILAP